jgi:hypothetical protein
MNYVAKRKKEGRQFAQTSAFNAASTQYVEPPATQYTNPPPQYMNPPTTQFVPPVSPPPPTVVKSPTPSTRELPGNGVLAPRYELDIQARTELDASNQRY